MDPAGNARRAAAALGMTRRHFLGQGSLGLGALALGELFGDAAAAPVCGPASGTARPDRSFGRAKSVIYLHMAGAPPQHDLFEWKPKLVEHHLKPCPKDLLEGQRFAFIKGVPLLLGTPYKFARHGACGAWVSELLPEISRIVDEIAFVKSMRTPEFNHAPADLFLHTGDRNAGAASIGAWATWGLGSENKDLPGFIVMVTGGSDPTGGKSTWGSGFLPAQFQGVQFRGGKDAVFYLSDPPGLDRAGRRGSLDALRRLNELEHDASGDPETLARIEAGEMAFRMQVSVPEVADLAQETPATLEAYGAEPGKASFAGNCLLARRLVERGVRYVQLFDWGWDTHGTSADDDIVTKLPAKCRETDRPVAALIEDLKRRGLLDSTLVIWGGEFGRTAMNEARDGSKFLGRDHHPHAFTIFLAGAGVRPGFTLGATDDLGYAITESPVDVHDLQATILHLLGLDPHRLVHPYKGLNQRLIGPADDPKVRHELLA